jgi:3-deoxy-manno-octulosonate cytidylyltransferase (CMP-KDO synthetase)
MVATDSEDIFKAVRAFGGKALMTSPSHASGTDRVAEAAASLDYDIIVNVQGDEPLIRAEMIDAVIELLENPNVVKVVFDRDGFALYFSRSPIPYRRREGKVYQHVGLYSYRREALMKLTSLEPTALERTEGLEQLRALEHGIKIKVGITELETVGVDTPEDLKKAEQWLSLSS